MAEPRPGVRVFAPAKVNLTLHITGQREDGYHMLDSLVAFGSMGDWVTMGAGTGLSLSLEGQEAATLSATPDNLVLRAAALLEARNTAFRLQKNLPVASGIGGGSADAAAAFRGVIARDKALGVGLSNAQDDVLKAYGAQLLRLGADVPMCLLSAPARVQGIGDVISLTTLPNLPAVLINPRVPVATPDVFKLLQSKDNAPMPDSLPVFGDAAGLIRWLATQRNDLETPAIQLCPEIATVLDVLRAQSGCALARMSGSGATCFGVFKDQDTAKAAAQRLYQAHPDWWVAGGLLGDQSKAAEPVVS